MIKTAHIGVGISGQEGMQVCLCFFWLLFKILLKNCKRLADY